MEKKECILQDSASLKMNADKIYYLNRKIDRYKSDLSGGWKSSEFSSIKKEIDELRKRLDRIVYELEDLSKEYLQHVQV